MFGRRVQGKEVIVDLQCLRGVRNSTPQSLTANLGVDPSTHDDQVEMKALKQRKDRNP